MQITIINTYQYKTNYSSAPAFKSYKHIERAQAKLREQQEKQKEFEELFNRVNTILKGHNYQASGASTGYDAENEGYLDFAQWMLNFICETLNASTHTPAEFFETEEKAANIRKDYLSSSCKKTSLELRQKIQNLEPVKDPVMGLIAANKMKEFLPDGSIVNNNQIQETIIASKKCFISAVKNSDKSAFNEYEQELMGELVDIIGRSFGLDFGEIYENKLNLLISSVNNRLRQKQEQLIAEQNRMHAHLQINT